MYYNDNREVASMKKNNMIPIILIIVVLLGLLYFWYISTRVLVTKIYLNKENISLFINETEKLDITIEPDNATDKKVLWESSNSSVATVDENGTVTALNEGVVVITVKTKDEKITDYCMVKVLKKDLSQIAFKEEKTEIILGESKELEVNVDPIELKEMFSYISSDESIVKVDEKGKIYGIKNGKATISIKIRDDIVATCEVIVAIPVETIAMENESLSLEVDEEKQLKYVVIPQEAANQEVIWTSSDENIVKVDNNGKVKGTSTGKVTVTVTMAGKTATCEVTVIIPVKGVKLNKSKVNLEKGKTATLTATISPTDATNKAITWTSSNEKVVKVDKNGKVTGIGAGEATITATASGKKALCKIVVVNPSIVNNSKYYSGYNTTSTYNSDTLKYRIMHSGKDEYVLIWVENANKQWNSAMPKIGQRFKPTDILNQEIKKYGYQKKGLIATNGSAFWDNWGDYPTSPFMINKGNIVRDIINKDYPRAYGFVGITKDGMLKLYHGFNSSSSSENSKKKQTVLDDGVRNNFTIFNELLKSDGSVLKSSIRVKYTALCQVNENNFVIYSGESLTFEQTAVKFRDSFGCRVAYRFDGGGSTTLYYKTSSMSSAKSIRSGRDLPDMMYFVEQ